MTFTRQQRAERTRALRQFTDRLKQMNNDSLDEALELAWSDQKADDALGWLWISCMAAEKANRIQFA